MHACFNTEIQDIYKAKNKSYSKVQIIHHKHYTISEWLNNLRCKTNTGYKKLKIIHAC